MRARRDEARIISLTVTAEEIAAKQGAPLADVLAALLAIERHTHRAKTAWERQNDSAQQAYSLHWEKVETREGDKVAEIAATLGLKTSWPGLYPSFTDAAGHSVSWNWGS
jgi:hypothetical protein